ncbi:hypothetical protein ASE12_12400 [Aeromicrobium sp. Root236]|uniref:hypothetical protein n=1 Tax=Aeromicrobium sp. Root236 TaxID=1736498 RepID=UPI0006FCD456|nr:hypothetical protein [Aeromicrobium sp. Root236]KRC65483.1 hypothetical protein ASE12_12400 [Aeromicrobium sp. Root236]
MTFDRGSAATTVTLFGGSDPLDHALSAHLDRRGCKTHSVTVATGWLQSATHAILRLDTVAGAEAFKQLAATPEPRSHVVAVCPETDDAAESDRVRDLCRACGVHHDVALIWHPPLGVNSSAAATASTTTALASTVANEMADHLSVGAPAFVTRPFTFDSDAH